MMVNYKGPSLADVVKSALTEREKEIAGRSILERVREKLFDKAHRISAGINFLRHSGRAINPDSEREYNILMQSYNQINLHIQENFRNY